MPLNNPTGGMQWTDEHCDELKRLAGLKKSFRVIAVEINRKFGTSYSRNATIGKATRMGLKKENAPSVPYADRSRNPSHKSKGIRSYIARRATHNSNTMRLMAVDRIERPHCIEIECLVPSHIATECQYPQGDGPFFMCNGPKQIGSYCLAHHAATHQPLRPVRDVAFVRDAA